MKRTSEVDKCTTCITNIMAVVSIVHVHVGHTELAKAFISRMKFNRSQTKSYMLFNLILIHWTPTVFSL